MSRPFSYCVVNSNGRELLLRCLEAIDATGPWRVEREVLVLGQRVRRRLPPKRFAGRPRIRLIDALTVGAARRDRIQESPQYVVSDSRTAAVRGRPAERGGRPIDGA